MELLHSHLLEWNLSETTFVDMRHTVKEKIQKQRQNYIKHMYSS